MRIEHNSALKKILEIFLDFKGKPPPNQHGEWQKVENYVTTLVNSGYTRKDIYHLINDVYDSHAEKMSPECSDALSNYITGLIGDVAVGYIVRLPGELGDDDEHALYVRSMKWLRH